MVFRKRDTREIEMQLTTATPAEIDTEIARIGGEIAYWSANAARAERLIVSLVKDLEKLGENLDEETLVYYREKRAGANRDAETAYAKANRIRTEQLMPLNAEYNRRGGWTRYYMVDNNNGHLHTHTECRNTYPTTEWYWMTGLSGLTADEAVEQAGELSCLTCFPGQRAEIEAGRPCRVETPRMTRTREQREADAKAKADKRAAAAAKAITNPDGSTLVIPDGTQGRTIKTEIAAQRAASEAAFSIRWYNDTAHYSTAHPATPEWEKTITLCLTALAHKRGTDVEAERAALAKRVETKFVRETR
jgi:hypothetical protein